MKVEVLPQDIRDGSREDTALCPVALAVKRCAGVNFAQVDYRSVLYGNLTDEELELGADNEDKVKRAELPVVVTDLITLFDDHNIMYPFGFEL